MPNTEFFFFLAIFFIFDIKKSIYLKIDVFPLILSNMLVFRSGVLGHSLALIKFYFNLKNEILVNLSESLYIIYICDPYVLSSILIFLHLCSGGIYLWGPQHHWLSFFRVSFAYTFSNAYFIIIVSLLRPANDFTLLTNSTLNLVW